VAAIYSFSAEGAPSALSASLTRTSESSPYVAGWNTRSFIEPYQQIPIIGAAFNKLSNPNATPGIAGRYGLTYPHLIEQP
jgi:hypothetical protein